ncbi:enterobactin ABC transporter permease [Thioclava sp. SK-1]|uniref:iron chelate uptake ABC transporter family permease subunit n=1 Tax=Thioclava sp. SK-1 TaxID=1889770 RepID=UPI0008245E86|nr:iron chelate uptake ABC transporter family permease subunit [Thioclava sp. SK-1]OCX62329.1 enterobactin ABC transporter permease [Thioclava sp. SK-1]
MWLFQGISGNYDFILMLRAKKLGALICVGAAVAVSTVIFQTVSANRILTPSIMGFDALYVMMQTLLVASLGVAGFAALASAPKFLLETGLMTGLALALFGTLLHRGARDIARMILTGVILGTLFRAGSGLLARLMDPNAYATVQSVSFANFARAQTDVLSIAAVVTALALAAAIWLGPRLDVLALGRERAISLGLPHARIVILALVLVAILVSVSTALVGPVAFFGLIVAGLAHMISNHMTGGARHRVLLPVSALVAITILVVGQTVFERLLGQQATLSVVIEFAGGLFFLWLLLKGKIR